MLCLTGRLRAVPFQGRSDNLLDFDVNPGREQSKVDEAELELVYMGSRVVPPFAFPFYESTILHIPGCIARNQSVTPCKYDISTFLPGVDPSET